MATSKTKCPECELTFDVPPGASGSVACPICDTACSVSTDPSAPRQPVLTLPVPAAPVAVTPAALKPPTVPVNGRNASATTGRRIAVAAAVLGGLLFVSIGVGLAAYVWKAGSAASTAVAVVAPAPADPLPPAVVPSAAPAKPRETPPAPKPEATVVPPELVPADPPAPAVDPAPKQAQPVAPMIPVPQPAPRKVLTEDEIKVNRAVERGAVYLKKGLDERGREMLEGYVAGVSALIGLTLLECGVEADDRHIVDLAKTVRSERGTLNHTYSLSLAIFFLDRLGDPKDQALIETFALRLAAAQNAIGSWTYTCPILTPAEEQKFSEYLKANAYVVPDSRMAGKPRGTEKLPTKLKALPIIGWQRGVKVVGNPGPLAGDNSNAQFALLALWVAQRHGVAIQPSLAFVERYFRSTVTGDGGWSYRPFPGPKKLMVGGMPSTPSMTCAGLLGLAVGHGVAVRLVEDKNKNVPAGDAGVTKGIRALDKHIKPLMINGRLDAPVRGPRRDFYLYWSLERVAVIYDLKVIGGREWYPRLSKILVEAQMEDGSWDPAAHNTCFALLVLRRANVAKDLTSSLKSSLNIKDLKPE